MSDLREKNLKTIQEVVNDIRANTKDSVSNGMRSLFFEPTRRNPLAKGEIEFISNEDYGLNDDKLLSNIYTMYTPTNNKSNILRPVVNFDVNLNKPLIEVVEQNYQEYENKIKTYQQNVANAYYGLTAHSVHNKEDKIIEYDHANSINNAEFNLRFIKQNKPKFHSNDEKHILTFVVGHELAHLSFKDRNEVKWEKIPQLAEKMNQNEMKDLSSVIYSLNRATDSKSQHYGANYLSSRDEIHSDISGLFLMTYIAMKNGTFDDKKFNDIYQNLGKMREINNLSADVNGLSTHNSSIVFEKKNLQAIKDMATAQIKNPHIPIEDKILTLTENLFFNSLKQNGITIIPTNDNLIVDKNLKNALKQNSEHFEVKNVYTAITTQRNIQSALDFNSCVKNVDAAYKNNCQGLLQGNQLNIIDPDSDKIINSKSLNQTSQDIINKTQQHIKREADIFSNFVNTHSISVSMENRYGDNTINLTNKELQFPYVK